MWIPTTNLCQPGVDELCQFLFQLLIDKSSHREVFYKKTVLKNFLKIHRETPVLESLLSKVEIKSYLIAIKSCVHLIKNYILENKFFRESFPFLLSLLVYTVPSSSLTPALVHISRCYTASLNMINI